MLVSPVDWSRGMFVRTTAQEGREYREQEAPKHCRCAQELTSTGKNLNVKGLSAMLTVTIKCLC